MSLSLCKANLHIALATRSQKVEQPVMGHEAQREASPEIARPGNSRKMTAPARIVSIPVLAMERAGMILTTPERTATIRITFRDGGTLASLLYRCRSCCLRQSLERLPALIDLAGRRRHSL